MEVRKGVEILGPVSQLVWEKILTTEAIDFVAYLSRSFYFQRENLINWRKLRQKEIDRGQMPDFLKRTAHIRNNSSWQVNSVPKDLEKRWVEITGPAGNRKMVINALNSGADVYMADFEDSQSPTWQGLIEGQINLYEAVRRTISFDHPKRGRIGLNEKTATLMVRPRGWHLLEKHFLVDGRPISASLFDFGLFFYHNAKELIKQGSGPYCYLAKLENQTEALPWDRVFRLSQKYRGIPSGSIKATVLIESILAAFEAEEILWTLREHSAGLNVGRWDYIASFAKKFRNLPNLILPDRGAITMTTHCMKSYADYVIKVCHKRGAHAIGGMAAQIPINDNPQANEEALAKVRADKEREVKAGHDGTWVAHPDLVPVAREVFAKHLGNKPNQIDIKRDDVWVTAKDLLDFPGGLITEDGLIEMITSYVKYVTEWLKGIGAVAIAYHDKNNKRYAYLMDDAATAEISRTIIWIGLNKSARLADGRVLSLDLILDYLEKVISRLTLAASISDLIYYKLATIEFLHLLSCPTEDFPEYLTLPAYDTLLTLEEGKEEIHGE